MVSEMSIYWKVSTAVSICWDRLFDGSVAVVRSSPEGIANACDNNQLRVKGKLVFLTFLQVEFESRFQNFTFEMHGIEEPCNLRVDTAWGQTKAYHTYILNFFHVWLCARREGSRNRHFYSVRTFWMAHLVWEKKLESHSLNRVISAWQGSVPELLAFLFFFFQKWPFY